MGRWGVFVGIVIFAVLPCAWAEEPKVEAVKVEKGEVVVEYKRFDPRNLPDPPPPLKEGEAAVCIYRYEVEVDSRYSYRAPANEGATTSLEVTITSVSARLSLAVTVWLPKGATDALAAHEEGHRRIAEHYYATADGVAKELASKLIGQKASGEGKDVAAAGRAAVDRVNDKLCKDYLEAVNRPCERAQEAFDRLTDHGRKGEPAVEEGVKTAIKEASAKR